MKLTKAQRKALSGLAIAENMTSSAYRLKCSTATLWSRERLNLVRPLGGLGSMAFPRTMNWEIKPAGRTVLRESESQ